MCHIAKICEDDKAREEAGEGVDARGDQAVPVAVVMELVIAGVGKMDTKPCTNTVEYLDRCINPNLAIKNKSLYIYIIQILCIPRSPATCASPHAGKILFRL